MYKQSYKRALAATATSLLLTATLVGARQNESTLKITPNQSGEKQHNRKTPTIGLSREENLARIHPDFSTASKKRSLGRNQAQASRAKSFAHMKAATAPTIQSFGTGGGDLLELEPNDRIAQGVSLPVNVFGEISVDQDVDFFAFEGLAGQQVTIEAFAARLRGSELIADIVLFDATGNLIDSDFGDEDNDPIIRYTPSRDQVLIVGIADADDSGGLTYDYMLNITRGVDVEELEPNDTRSQGIEDLPVTVFGEVEGRNDVDFYSFIGSAGQTLIVDVDAEVLGSRLDPEINLIDPEFGTEYFYNDQYDGDDSRYNIVLPYTGRYIIGIGAFDSNSSGFYRLNISTVSGTGAPIITQTTRVSKKLLEVSGAGFGAGSVIEVNGIERRTTYINSGTIRAKVKARVGDVVTVSNPPDDRRSNPLIVQ
jgi:hypothetical protein